ncbi:hypothetical protein [Nocardioides nitrophenolicus]|uniref:hypothetical protein n=1 Tax=Nocardioides nitrophenolicus TaxID=60489 RepID=UPI00195C94C4|nr:hypothetical protein [Nocardioides nitrophenolicus]MBM7518923.1 hypothetical protein [Nocardioides nitrophenolicus]
MTRLRALALATGGVLAGSLLAVVGTAVPARAAADPCAGAVPGGLTRFEWDGEATDDAWSTPKNWKGDVAPGTVEAAIVCFPDLGRHYDVDATAVYVHVQALGAAGDVTITATDSRLLVYGGASRDIVSTIGSDAELDLRASYFGGTGVVELAGRLGWGTAGFGTVSLDNDICDVQGLDLDSCGHATAPLPTHGRLRVLDGGVVTVAGRGVNLADGYALDVASGGRLLLTGAGYVAADRDTAITVEPGGILELAGDASVFEGEDNDQPDLARLTNDGTVLKSAGGGASALNVTYAGTGRVDVRTGGLSISGTAPITADLRAGARLGTASCGDAGPASDAARPCLPTTSATDRQIAVLAPRQATTGVVLQEGATLTQAGDLQPAVSISAPAVPSTLYLELQDPRPAAELVVFRSRPGLQQRIPLCGAGGTLPPRVSACIVGRRGEGGRSQLEVVTTDPSGLWSLRPSAVDFVRLVDPLVGAREGCAVSQPAYPFVAREQIRLLRPGGYALYFSTIENDPSGGVAVHTGVGGPGRAEVPIPVTANGWVAVVATGADGRPESTGSFRVVATPAVTFRKRSRAAIAGRPFVIEGRVKPKGRRVVELYAVRVTGASGVLAPTRERVRTDRKGRFRVVHRPKRAGRWVYAVRVRGKGALSTAMSRQAVRVSVRAPAPAPPPTVVRHVRAAETTTTTASADTPPPVDPLDLIGPFYPGRVQRAAPACRFQVAR